jgi:hypothetical protein
MTPESQNGLLLDNGSLGTFPKQRIGLWENQTFAMKVTHVSATISRHGRIEELLERVTYSVCPPNL